MLLGIEITNAGKDAVENYDGSNGHISFLEAFILGRAIDSYASISDLVRTINNDYPYTMEPEALVKACLRLEEKSFLTLRRGISDTDKIYVQIAGIKFCTHLASLSKENPGLPIEKIRSDLQDRGRTEIILTRRLEDIVMFIRL